MNKSRITVYAVVDADKKKVWKYYNDPVHIVNWNFADPSWHCPAAENDMRVGGTYKARMEAKDGSFGFDMEGTYSEVSEGESFTYEFGGREATVKFKEVEDQTEVTVSFDPETENPVDMQKAGWQAILDNFKQHTESH